MRKLKRYVVIEYAADWFYIGMELGLPYYYLKAIKHDNPMNMKYCLRRTLSGWLETDVNPTWKALEIALTNVNRVKLGLNLVDDLYEHGKDVYYSYKCIYSR